MQRFVGAVVLTVLAGLPVMATTCEAFCERGAAPASTDAADDMSMDQGMAGCHESPAPVEVRITGASAHDCRSHGDGVRETEAALISGRTEIGILSVANAPAFAPIVLAFSSLRVHAGYSPPPDTSPTHAPLVLRV